MKAKQQPEQVFDFAAWQDRMKFTAKNAADALGVSLSFYHALRAGGKGRKVYAWAAYGIEAADHTQKRIQA